MKCENHAEKEAVGICNLCSKNICSDCSVNLKGELYCKSCLAEKTGGGKKKQEHSPALAAILSFIIAGLGQIYNGQVWKGVFIFITSLFVIPWIFGIFDAYFVAKKIARGEIELKKKTGCLLAMIICIFVSWIMIAIIALIGAIAIPVFLKTGMLANEKAIVATLNSISSAFESYAQQNNNIYPLSEESLIESRPQYLSVTYDNKVLYGYKLTEDLRTSGYTIVAEPTVCLPEGKIYIMETGGKLSEKECDSSK